MGSCVTLFEWEVAKVTFPWLSQGDGELSVQGWVMDDMAVSPTQLFCSSSPKVQCPPFRIPPPV